MHVLLSCKYEEDRIKIKDLECSQYFSHYKSMGIFPDAQGQLPPLSLVRSDRISNSSEILWMSSLHSSMKKNDKKEGARGFTTFSPIITLWELFVAMETRVLIRSVPIPNKAFPLPQ